MVLTFVGRVQALKAPDLLLRAAAELAARCPERALRVLVVGGTSGAGADGIAGLRSLAAELGIAERVSFLAPRAAEDLVEVYRASDVVAVPSHSESFGLVALEAQACGTPVVAADVGGLGTAIADGVSGLLVGTHRTRDWADALATLVDDPARRAQFAAAAPAHAAHFSWDRTADGLLQTYADAGRERAGLLRRRMLGATA